MSMLFKRIKDWAVSIASFRTGDVIPVDGPSGTAKMSKDDLLQVTAQNALAGNEAPAFDESGTTIYIRGQTVVRLGIVYTFKKDHNGPWSDDDVELSYINNCGIIDNGGIGNPSNVYKVKTRVLPFDVNKPLIIKITKPLRSAGNYYKIGYQLVTDSNLIGRYARNGDYAYSTEVNAEDGILAGAQFTLVNRSLQNKGIAVEIVEYNSSNVQVANRKEDFIGYSISILQPVEPYKVFFNGGLGNPNNANKVHTEIIPLSGGLHYTLNLDKSVRNAGNYFKIGYVLTGNINDLGRNGADVVAGGSYIYKVDAGQSTGLKIDDVLDLTTRTNVVGVAFEICEFDSSNNAVQNRYNDFYGHRLSANFYKVDKKPMFWGSIPDGGTLAYLTGHSGGHLKWSYRIQSSSPNAMSVGSAMATFTNDSSPNYKHIDYIQSPVVEGFPFRMETDGTRHRIVNASGRTIEISSLFCAGNWQYADNWNAPLGWTPNSVVIEGDVNNLFTKTREASVDLSAINAISRINVDSNGSKDFCAMTITDSHGDDKSVRRACDYSGAANAVSAVIHCGDYVSDFVSYGQASSGWSDSVENCKKPAFFVMGNHEKGNYKNIALTPTDATLYNLFVKPIVDKGYLSVGEYEENKCYYYHDFSALKVRLIILDEYRAPLDYDETYWQAIAYDSSIADVVGNTDYVIGDKVNVPGFTANSFQAVQNVNTGSYSSGKHPCYKCRRGYRYIDNVEAQWFLDTLYTTPSDYQVVVAMHNPFSDMAVPDKTKKFCQQINVADNVTGASWSQNYLAVDYVSDALNAFKTGSYYSATISTKSGSDAAYIADYTVSKDFSLRGPGKLGVIIGGHVHRDIIWKHPTYTYMYQVTPMCANTTNSNANRYSDIRLQRDSLTGDYVDSLTAVSVADNRIALAKVGCRFTTDARYRDIEVF